MGAAASISAAQEPSQRAMARYRPSAAASFGSVNASDLTAAGFWRSVVYSRRAWSTEDLRSASAETNGNDRPRSVRLSLQPGAPSGEHGGMSTAEARVDVAPSVGKRD